MDFDNNDDNAAAAAGGGEGVPQPPENDPDDDTTYVDTKIEEVMQSGPNERKFSVKFDDFEELPSEKGHEVRSSTFSCFGHEWRLAVYPGGYEDQERSSLDGKRVSGTGIRRQGAENPLFI